MASLAHPTTKAWTFTRPGLPRHTLSLTTSHPTQPFPPPSSLVQKSANGIGPEQWLRIRVSHAALNPADIHYMAGALIPEFLRCPTAVPGLDLVGTVTEVWPPVEEGGANERASGDEDKPHWKFRAGDKVVALQPLAHMLRAGTGTFMGEVTIPAKFAVRVPEGKTLRECAGLFLAACTAAKQVEEAGVREGNKVLVVGASGGIGSMAVQLVREIVGGGGLVVGVCSGRNADMVKGLGADEVIDYTQFTDLPAELAKHFGDDPLDAVIDTFGNQDLYRHCAGFLKPDGVYSAVGVHSSGWSLSSLLPAILQMQGNALWPMSPWLGGTGRTWKGVSMMDPGVDLMERLVKLFGEGKLRVAVDSEWPFERVLEAYDVLLSGRARGKIILKVNDDDV